MDTQYAGIITLLRSALKNESLILPENFQWDEAAQILKKHQLTGLAIQGAVLCGVPRTHPTLTRMMALFCGGLRASRNQRQKLREVFDLFEANGIAYMPVKGAVLQTLYSQPEYRTMSDADILIRQEQYPLICKLLSSLGLTEQENSDYEQTWSCPALKLELHRCLVSSRFSDYYDHYSDSWQLAQENDAGCGYHLSPEEHFIYLIAHFAKHYRAGTICARDICDFYVWRNTYPDMDEAYILHVLSGMRLANFYRNILDLLDNWFDGAAATPATELITTSAFRGGVYKEFNRSAADELLRRHSNDTDILIVRKLHWFFHTLFPSRTTMAYAHPVLNKYPVLLPLFWAARWFDALFRGRNKLRRGKLIISADSADISEYEEHMAAIGLKERR